MADITTLTADATPGSDSLIYTVDDPAGTPLDRKVTIANLFANAPAITTTGAITGGTLAISGTSAGALNIGGGNTFDGSRLIVDIGTIPASTTENVIELQGGIGSGGTTGIALAFNHSSNRLARIKSEYAGTAATQGTLVFQTGYAAVADALTLWGDQSATFAGDLRIGTASAASTESLRVNGSVYIDGATEDIHIKDAGSTSATEQDWIEVTVGGVTGYIRVYATK